MCVLGVGPVPLGRLEASLGQGTSLLFSLVHSSSTLKTSNLGEGQRDR